MVHFHSRLQRRRLANVLLPCETPLRQDSSALSQLVLDEDRDRGSSTSNSTVRQDMDHRGVVCPVALVEM